MKITTMCNANEYIILRTVFLFKYKWNYFGIIAIYIGRI